MKKVLLPVCAGILLLASCKENDPAINYPKAPVAGTIVIDTTYVLSGTDLSSLTTDPHQVLVEEYSGQQCANCPKGHADLEAFDSSHPGRLNYVCLYETGVGTLAEPVPGSANDFENVIAHNISVFVSGAVDGSLPSASIDRVPDVVDGIFTPIPDWDPDITARMANPDSVNLSISSTYSGNTATIIATVTYTQPVTGTQNLTLDLVEDSIYDYQYDNRSGHSLTDTNYLFTNVFRDMITTSPQGDAILDSVTLKERGRVYKHSYTYTLPTITGRPAINPAHCRVVGFVSIPGTGGNHEIMQSAQTKLMGP